MHYYRNPDFDIQKSLAGAYKKGARGRDEDVVSAPATSKEEVLIHLMDAYREASNDPEAQRLILKKIRSFAARNNPLICRCNHNYLRNPTSLDFVIDFYAMLDALKRMNDAAQHLNMPLPIEFDALYQKLDRADHNFEQGTFLESSRKQ